MIVDVLRLAALALLVAGGQAMAQQVLAVSEESMPLQYTSHGTIVGPAADLVRETLRRADLPFEVRLYPWPRAYAMAQIEPNVLIFSIARNDDREQQFKWVGEVYPAEFRFIKLKSRTDIVIKSLDDARKYSIGVINKDITHEFLAKRDFSLGQLDITANNDINFKKLVAGRLDLVLRSKRALDMLCLRDKAMCDKLETSYVVKEMKMSLWMAFSKNTPDDIVARARTSYNAVRADGSWNTIMLPLSH
ncbi:MAG: transporter substrate-binding domain-containing protein [Pseudomonadota bacterium]